ncbi:hypothetical protein FRC09_004133 [Ceratobasidium sp. 395]|nr:hypothetical protein FRC09_004133 [Ceratobasidium sp. 395]
MLDTNATRVFNNSALLDMICGHLCRRDLLRLLRTSRPAFNSAAPRIWKTLDSVGPLLMLLSPKVELKGPEEIVEDDDEEDDDESDEENDEESDEESEEEDDEEDGADGDDQHGEHNDQRKVEKEVMNVTLPEYGPHTFERFNRYNLFVQNLSIISNKWNLGKVPPTKFRLLSWSTLSSQARHTPLLPNLHDLSVHGGFSDGDEATFWLSTFISHSLRTLNFYPDYGNSIPSYHYTTTILGLLTQKCSQLQKLSHKLSITAAEYGHEFIEKAAASQLVLTPLACGHLQSLQHLAQLMISGNFIDSETLVVLSRLPKLEKLTINQAAQPNKHLPQAFKDAQLSEGSFPALEHLRIRSHVLDDFLAAWNPSPLVSGLNEISLKYESTKKNQVRPIYEDTILRPLLRGISTSSPDIEYLTLISTRMGHPLSTDLGSSPWTCIEHLPLRYLELVNFNVDAASLKNVQQVWHKLITLSIPDQLLALEHLVHLGRLPKLKKLCAAGFKDLIEQIPEAEIYECAPLHTVKLKKPLTDRVKIKSTEKVAR